VTFPDGFGEKYTYDMFGRRMTKSQFNHQGNVQDTTVYHYKGDSWVITDEKDGEGNTVLTYTFNEEGRPLSVTFKGQTFWYVYNGHGDVTALTDKNGEVAVRYEYDDWGLVSRMYNRYGEREGIGWIGDQKSGNGSPGSLQGPEDSSGNTEPDYHPGIGNAPADGTSATAATVDAATTADAFAWLDGEPLDGIEEEPSEDITTELAKVNPYCYAGYYWDRKTQMYFLQARYYDPREARFISADSYRGEGEHPLSLNLYTYALNNPVNLVDPTGHMSWWQIDDLAMGSCPHWVTSQAYSSTRRWTHCGRRSRQSRRAKSPSRI
jgi:RHS repeat-associated protein